MVRLLMLLSSAALALAPAALHAQASAYDLGRAARMAGRLDEAERLLRQALARDQNHYLAMYHLGLVYEGRAVRAPAGEPRLRHYRTAAEWLERAYAERRRSNIEEFTILNSLGTVYLSLGELSRAETYLMEGYRERARLSDQSKGRLYGNIGYLHALRGDTAGARRFFEAGAQLGSSFSRESLARMRSAGF